MTSKTSIDRENAARATLRGDWDEYGTTTMYLPTALAESLLERRGWTRHRGGGWVSPSDTIYWERDEALTVALVAEAL